MALYVVIDKSTSQEVYRYESDAPIEWLYMSFATHDHILQDTPPFSIPNDPSHPYEWLLDVGAFFDRFGPAKFSILTSTDPIVKAIVQDVMVRKWVDLRRADVTQGVNMIAAKIPALTYDIKMNILTTPVKPDENLALRIMYFTEKN